MNTIDELPQYPTVLEFLKHEIRSILGAEVNLDPNSDSGQVVALVAKLICDIATTRRIVLGHSLPQPEVRA